MSPEDEKRVRVIAREEAKRAATMAVKAVDNVFLDMRVRGRRVWGGT